MRIEQLSIDCRDGHPLYIHWVEPAYRIADHNDAIGPSCKIFKVTQSVFHAPKVARQRERLGADGAYYSGERFFQTGFCDR
jgi:hypothetical protein